MADVGMVPIPMGPDVNEYCSKELQTGLFTFPINVPDISNVVKIMSYYIYDVDNPYNLPTDNDYESRIVETAYKYAYREEDAQVYISLAKNCELIYVNGFTQLLNVINNDIYTKIRSREITATVALNSAKQKAQDAINEIMGY